MAWNFLQRILGSKAADGAKSATGATPRAESPTSDEERVRRSARRRLIGAGVLVVLTVAIFPWVFERQPKPVNDDIVIEIPRKEGAKPLPLPVVNGAASAASAAASASASASPASVPTSAPSYPAITRIVGDAPATPDPKPVDPGLGRSPVAAVLGAVAPDPVPVVTPVVPSATTPPTITPPASKPAAAASASKPTASAPAASGRFIVQVAAFSEAIKARDTRLKLEAAGYKTYSQAIETPKGKVWRVRIGPVDNRAKADAVKAKMLLQGFNAVVIEL